MVLKDGTRRKTGFKWQTEAKDGLMAVERAGEARKERRTQLATDARGEWVGYVLVADPRTHSDASVPERWPYYAMLAKVAPSLALNGIAAGIENSNTADVCP